MDKLELFECIRNGKCLDVADNVFPFYPLNSEGMPEPGPDFLDAAAALPGIDVEPNIEYLYRRALYDEQFALPVVVKNRTELARFVPGHKLGSATRNFAGGPIEPAEVMIISKNPGPDEVCAARNLVSPSSEPFYQACQDCGIEEEELFEWYATNLIRFPQLDRASNAIPNAHIKDCAILLAQEIKLVRPKYILCLGAEALKALLGTGHSISSTAGQSFEYRYAIHAPGQEPQYCTAQVMSLLSPAFVARKPEQYDQLLAQFRLFCQLIKGEKINRLETDIDHRVVYSVDELSSIIDEIVKDPEPIIAVDAEWHGDNHMADGAYLRTIQFSAAHKQAVCVVLRHAGGEPAFQPSGMAAIEELKRLLKYRDGYRPRIGGHFLRADIPWLVSVGLDIRDEYMPDPDDPRKGGWDTSLMHHAFNETARFKLEEIGIRLTTVPRYDNELQAWKDAKKRELKKKDEELEGYGECPDEILHPYANYDADTTRRLAIEHMRPGGLLDADRDGNNSWTAYHLAHRASAAFLEMEMLGIATAPDRADSLAIAFMAAAADTLGRVRSELSWPTFNPASHPQMVSALFGDQYVGKVDKDGNVISIRPPGARSLGLHPIKTTGKRPMSWDRVNPQDVGKYKPATDKESLGILGQHNPVVKDIRNYRFLNQVLCGALRRPLADDKGELVQDEDGNFVYEKGIMGSLWKDGRVHTHLFQTKETGRGSSARPPLQNLSKRREDDYHRLLGPNYLFPVRTILRASEGCVLIEADFTSAELAVLAWISQDPTMIDHVRRNLLPEDHPDFLDMHSQMAVDAFKLHLPPTKKALKDAGIAGLRVAAKNVNFGVPYGRGAEAISRQCAEEGADVDIKQAQRLIDMYYMKYPLVEQFLTAAGDQSQSLGWIRTPYGRYRRFMPSADDAVIKDQRRQAQNFPIQGSVADAMNIALYNLMQYRKLHGTPDKTFNILLQIHDACLLEAPIAAAAWVVEEVLPACMAVPFYPARLDGTPIPVAEPYKFGFGVEVCLNWGEHVTQEIAKELGLPLSLAV